MQQLFVIPYTKRQMYPFLSNKSGHKLAVGLTVNSEAANFLGIPSSFPNDSYLFKGVLEGGVISFSCIGNELAYSRAYI